MREQITNQIPKIDKSSISVIHNSVDVELFSPDTNKSVVRDVILFTGRLTAAKGINVISKAIPKVLRLFPDALFVFVGPGNSELYQRQLRLLGVPARNFLFTGYLKETSDLVRYYNASSVYLAPSLYENLPIRVLEAMSCGVPVVASNVCAIPEAIDDGVNGLLIKPGFDNDLSNAICRLLSDPGLRKEIGENARKKVLKMFNWKINASRITDVYDHILNNSDGKPLEQS
jgi:glycosyltransferase involved in cell wall biosynthesis